MTYSSPLKKTVNLTNYKHTAYLVDLKKKYLQYLNETDEQNLMLSKIVFDNTFTWITICRFAIDFNCISLP